MTDLSRRSSDRRGERASGSGPGFVTMPVSGLTYDFDAARGVTVATGVSQWTDQVTGTVVATSSPGSRQPVYNASDLVFLGRPSIQFDGSDDFLACTNASSEWKFLHDGTGSTSLLISSHSSTFSCWPLGSTRVGATWLGMNFGSDPNVVPSRRGYYDAAYGNGSTLIVLKPATKDTSGSDASTFQLLTLTGTTPLVGTLYASEQGGVATSDSSINASSSNPEAAMKFGYAGNGSVPCAVRIARACFWSRVLTSGEITTVINWANVNYGART